MRSLILIAAALLIQQQAFAGIGVCRNRIDLVCEAKLSSSNGSSKPLTSGVGRVYNQDPELFVPVDCEGSVVLNTEAGKFVAQYRDYDGTVTASLNPIEGRKSLLFLADPIDSGTKATVTVPNLSYDGYDSITFTCYPQVNYQYRYRFNPGE
jgi:hypothetical protein